MSTGARARARTVSRPPKPAPTTIRRGRLCPTCGSMLAIFLPKDRAGAGSSDAPRFGSRRLACAFSDIGHDLAQLGIVDHIGGFVDRHPLDMPLVHLRPMLPGLRHVHAIDEDFDVPDAERAHLPIVEGAERLLADL